MSDTNRCGLCGAPLRAHTDIRDGQPGHLIDAPDQPQHGQWHAFDGRPFIEIAAATCPHREFTADEGHPETALCDFCGLPPRWPVQVQAMNLRFRTPVVCLDCQLPYRDFPLDVILPRAQWLAIAEDADVLCAHCIVARVAARVPGATCCHLIVEVTPS